MGNILTGLELARKLGDEASQPLPSCYGLCFPLLTTSDGTKMGKSASGADWLAPGMYCSQLQHEGATACHAGVHVSSMFHEQQQYHWEHQQQFTIRRVLSMQTAAALARLHSKEYMREATVLCRACPAIRLLGVQRGCRHSSSTSSC